MKKQGYIYKYTYSNGKVYIGQTRVSVKERHYQHMSDSKNKNRRQLCELAIAKYGEPQLDVVETIDFDGDDNTKFIEKLNKAEKKWIKKYESTDIRKGYNIQNGGNIKNLEKYLLEERWYEIFDNQKWGHLLAFYKELLNSIGHKICVTNEKLTDEERRCWYSYKFMDYEIGKETTFSGFYNRNKDNTWLCDPGYLDYEIIDVLYNENSTKEELEEASKKKDELYFNQIISCAIEEHWIRDIRETIWKQVMKEKNDILSF